MRRPIDSATTILVLCLACATAAGCSLSVFKRRDDDGSAKAGREAADDGVLTPVGGEEDSLLADDEPGGDAGGRGAASSRGRRAEDAEDGEDEEDAEGLGGMWGIRHVKGGLRGVKGAIFGGKGGARAKDDPEADDLALDPAPRAAPRPADVGEMSRLDRAIWMIRDGNFGEARDLLALETKLNADNAEAWRWLGDCHYNLLDLQEAINAYERARSVDPTNYLALRNKGFAEMYLGRKLWTQKKYEASHAAFERARDLLSEAVERYPADMEASFVLAMACEGTSRKLYSDALRLQRAGQRDLGIRTAQLCLQQIDKGIQHAEDRTHHAPREVEPRDLAGRLFLRRAELQRLFGKREAARKSLDQAIASHRSILESIDGDNEKAKRNLALCQKRLNLF